MAKTLIDKQRCLETLRNPSRYWAGRHHATVIATICQLLPIADATTVFSAVAIDAAVNQALNRGQVQPLSKGTRWAYLKVLRDIGLVEALPGGYRLTKHGRQARAGKAGPRNGVSVLPVALFRPLDYDNPLHCALALFVDTWETTPSAFVTHSYSCTFERDSSTTVWVRQSESQQRIAGFGKNQLNQLWNGLLPFLEDIRLLDRIDGSETGGAIWRRYGAVWDWDQRRCESQLVQQHLIAHLKSRYPIGRMVTLDELTRTFWEEHRYSARLTLQTFDAIAANVAGVEFSLVRSPESLHGQGQQRLLIKDSAAYGAFVRWSPPC